jgi:hypothetical protein
VSRRRETVTDSVPLEWVGGRVLLPDWIDEAGGFQPELLLWLELPSDLIVAAELRDPRRGQPTFARVLRQALTAPAAGPPRRPARIRVAESALALQVRAVAGAKTEVVVAPTPEIDAAVRDLLETRAPRRRRLPKLQNTEGDELLVTRLALPREHGSFSRRSIPAVSLRGSHCCGRDRLLE